MESLVRLGYFGVLLCCALQAAAFWTDNDPRVSWVNLDPNNNPRSPVKASISGWDGKDPCEGKLNSATGKTENLCTSDIRTSFRVLNNYEDEHFLAECKTDGDLPQGIPTVCYLRVQRRSKRSIGFLMKTVVEIQVYNNKDKKMVGRFSEPYGPYDD